MRAWLKTEDGWAFAVGMLIVCLGLPAAFGVDLLGWTVATKEWIDPAKAVTPAGKAYATLPALVSLGLTYATLLGVFGLGAYLMAVPRMRFLVGFSIVFAVAYLSWFLGHFGYLAATPDKLSNLGIAWSLNLTGEAGYLLALFAGLIVGNGFPKAADYLKESARSELFIKAAIVIIGASLGVKAAEASGLASMILVRGLAAIIEAYLVYWAFVYLLARRVFGFSREWSAPLASGISICGVSAAITTGAAIKARPSVPVMVSSLVVVFSVIELLLLPTAARFFLAEEPMVAAAWMGLAVKTDGAAISSGAVTEALIYADAAERGIRYQQGWMILTTTTVKVFIDLFIGVWAVVLAVVWAYGIEPSEWASDDEKPHRLPWRAIWERFPKFVFGYVLTFAGLLILGLALPEQLPALKKGTETGDLFRRLFFAMTFFSIGLAANFRKLWAEGLGKLALVYVVALFGFIIWIGLAISWLFFHGMTPPLAGK